MILTEHEEDDSLLASTDLTARWCALPTGQETLLEYMIRVMRDPKANARRRDAMAAAAAPYVHHRLSSTEHSGPGGDAVQVVIQTGFVYDDAAGA